jgi:anti-sigma B factor antagonist/stage II sporulation protein AA (anti-sigma F factor antagonist)
MRLELTDDDGVVVAVITGDIDFGTAVDLGGDVSRAVPDSAVGLVLDLTDVRYVDSSGVRVFFELAAQLATSGRRVALAVPETSPIRRLVKITRLEEAIVLCTGAAECSETLRQA